MLGLHSTKKISTDVLLLYTHLFYFLPPPTKPDTRQVGPMPNRHKRDSIISNCGLASIHLPKEAWPRCRRDEPHLKLSFIYALDRLNQVCAAAEGSASDGSVSLQKLYKVLA